MLVMKSCLIKTSNHQISTFRDIHEVLFNVDRADIENVQKSQRRQVTENAEWMNGCIDITVDASKSQHDSDPFCFL